MIKYTIQNFKVAFNIFPSTGAMPVFTAASQYWFNSKDLAASTWSSPNKSNYFGSMVWPLIVGFIIS